jgi:hypothetical protein
MPNDYLHSTTYDPQMEDQQDIVDMMSSDAADQDGSNNPEDLTDLGENDMQDLEEHQDEDDPEMEEISADDADKLSPDRFDFENDQPDQIDYQLMGYMMGDSEGKGGQKMQYGGSTLGTAQTVYGPGSGVDQNMVKKLNSVKFAGLNRTASRYNVEPPKQSDFMDVQNYNNIRAKAEQFLQNDPTGRSMGITAAQMGGGTHDVRYQAGGKVGPEYNNPANRWQAGGYNTGYQFGGKPIMQHPLHTRFNVPGSKMGMPIGLHQAGGTYDFLRHKRQVGGDSNVLHANDDMTKRVGLNDQNYSKAILNLKGQNTIRGLDNRQPVAVTDGNKYKVLRGPEDTDQFNGKVFEKRL